MPDPWFLVFSKECVDIWWKRSCPLNDSCFLQVWENLFPVPSNCWVIFRLGIPVSVFAPKWQWSKWAGWRGTKRGEWTQEMLNTRSHAVEKNMTFQLADEWLIADDLKLQMTKDFPLCSFDHCTCGWLDSSPWEWSYFFSQRKFFHFSPSCSSFFLIFSFYFFHMKLMFLTLFFYLFLLYFFSLENVCLDSLFLSSFMLYLSLWTKILSSLCLFPISFFCHAHTFPLLLSFLSRYLCLQNHLNVKVQNREHLKTFHAHMQKQITDGVRCQ